MPFKLACLLDSNDAGVFVFFKELVFSKDVFLLISKAEPDEIAAKKIKQLNRSGRNFLFKIIATKVPLKKWNEPFIKLHFALASK